MTTPRHMLLRQPHMTHLLDHPALDAMSDSELRALEALMRFCAAQGLDDPEAPDIRACAQLCGQAPEHLEHLAGALARLGLPGEYLAAVREALEALRHRAEFRGITQVPQRSYARTVSLPPEALPPDWRRTLRRLRADGRYATSILDRMERRLGMFAWAAQRGGHPVDLASLAALTAFYGALRGRSAEKNDGTPRWAYVRSTWEELHRFARAHGLPQTVCGGLSSTYGEMVRLEQKQEADKWSKLLRAGTAHGLLAKAEEMLAKAGEARRPQMRHARRNTAAAIGLGIAVPARPEDVHVHHVLGKGVFFEAGCGGYRFRYVPRKTRGTHPEPLDILLRPHWNRFIDALILQDQDPRYLGELRAQALADHRPLYVNYDGTHCAYGWYSRAWEKVAATGGHIARSLIYDEMADLGEFGIQYARGVNDHRTDRIPAKYRSENAVRASYRIGHEALISRGLDEDISDLL